MSIKRIFRLNRQLPKPDREEAFISENLDNVDNKDIIAFVIAAYQLFIPLIIAFLFVGGLLAVVLLYVF